MHTCGMADLGDDEPVDCPWWELLLENPLFERLREEGYEQHTPGISLVCEVRGDLFVWSQATTALLTTNLKRIKANPGQPQHFQTLVCTSAPLTSVLELLPDVGGVHIALRCEQALSVMKLNRHRGEHGEFGGGQETVNCKVVSIATDLFCIHKHSLKLLQAAWHPTRPAAICLLSSDGTLRLYSLANPNLPMLTVVLSDAAHASYRLEDAMVSFTFSLPSCSLFLLREDGYVHTTTLEPGSSCSPPLVMHPDAEDNYGSDACAILALSTSPCAVIIANSSGMIYHCVYLQGDQENGGSPEMLYVVESVKLDLSSTDTQITLMADPLTTHVYYALHPDGIHMVSLSWLARMEAFATSELSVLAVDTEAHVELLIATEPDVTRLQGVVIVSEPLLDYMLIGLTSDCECLTLPLKPKFGPHPQVADVPLTPGVQADLHSSGFEEVISDILSSESTKETSPCIRSFRGEKDTSQQKCFEFLMLSIQQLRTRSLLRQTKAKAALEHRIDILCRQKDQQLEDLVTLKDERSSIAQGMAELNERIQLTCVRSQQLVRRVEQLVCQLDRLSPVVSEAERSMSHELEALRSKMDHLQNRLYEARGKLELGLEGRYSTDMSLSARQSQTVQAALAEGGENIKTLMQQVKSLAAMTST